MAEETLDSLNPEQFRESRIPLPSREDGYATVMLVGTTGSGKTTVLRHLIGSDRERFPSTSTARTTTADFEIISDSGPYAGIVTFMSQREVKDQIKLCLYQACQVAVRGQSDDRIARMLLSSQDQRFRLSYPLGRWEPNQAKSDSSQRKLSDLSDESISDTEWEQIQDCLRDYVTRIRTIAQNTDDELTNDAGSTLEDAQNSGERQAWLDLFVELLDAEDALDELVSDITAEIRKRFDWISQGEFTHGNDGWPLAWEYQSQSRSDFLKEVRWFSSNHSEQFGKLLTPMVNGVRVRGEFAPADDRLKTDRKLVILDGEGIGHGAQSSTSIRAQITDRFPQVDLILLVDNAQQPMLSAPQELMKTAGSMGYADKLAFAFTHFENVIGDDLYSVSDREERVISPGRDAVDIMRSIVGDDVSEELADRVEDYAFFLESMDKPTAQLPSFSIGTIRNLLDTIEEAAHPGTKSVAKIVLSSRDLEMAIRDAVGRFHEPWEGWLGTKRHPEFPKEHWTRIKALTLRVVIGQNAYDYLQPVADLRSRLQEGVSRWLDRSSTVMESNGTSEERQAALTQIRQGVYAPLQSIALARVAEQHGVAWDRAYSHSGTGSSYRRADDIERIYKSAAPDIEFDKSVDARELINAVYQAILSALEDVDGRLD